MKPKPNDETFLIDAPPIATFYFAIFVLLFNLVVKYFFFIFNAGISMPIYSSSCLAFILGGFFGYLFGPLLARPYTASRIFFCGMLFALVILLFYSLGMQLILYFHHDVMFTQLHQWQDYGVLYGVILLFILLVAGIWFIPLTGLVALHFNRKFLPGYYAYLHKHNP